jgi:hypothetical protein
MAIDQSSLLRFVDRLPDLISASEIEIEKIRFPGRAGNNWDSSARQVMMEKFKTWLEQELGASEAEIADTLFIEGLHGSPSSLSRDKFFGSVCCPDLALKSSDGYKRAVELDRGRCGSRLRNALTKAGEIRGQVCR